MKTSSGNSIYAGSDESRRPTFLESVARAYVNSGDNLADLCFVFPNRRAGTFFLKALSKELGGKVALAPEIMAAPEFMERIAGRDVASRIDLLFRLYNVYKNLLDSKPELATSKGILDFDRFAPWGETVINDFNEVDRYEVDAHELFKNIRDYRNISSNFLTEEQLEVIERYFGFRPDSGDIEGFWKKVDSNFESSELKERFVELWRLLPELYDGLKRNLESEGLTMTGTSYLQALSVVTGTSEPGACAELPWSRVVVVGFNVLSTTEARLFGELASYQTEDGRSYAEFFWDATGPVLGAEADSHNAAARAVRRNMRNFPMPGWAREYIALSDVSELPERLVVTAAPSNVAQVKIAAARIREWGGEVPFKDARVAVVLPDENLLIPLIHSLPDETGPVNLTMGYPMRHTSTSSFVYHLRRLHMHRRRVGESYGYYHEDFRLFAAHPLVHIMIGTNTANAIVSDVVNKHIRVVTPEWLAGRDEPGARVLADMLRPLSRGAKVEETINYLSGVLDMVDAALCGIDEGSTVNKTMERIQLSLFQQALGRLRATVSQYGVEMSFSNVFHLVDRLLSGETVTFTGEPLEGLQIMGLLETRALDFDRIIVLSMNDKIMPSRSRARTFIPDALRRGYGLPPSTHGEELYAYYFYRMISRASDVTLVYDARAGEGMRSGGRSRFLMQLELLYGRGSIAHESHAFGLSQREEETFAVVKTEKVRERLGDYLTDDPERRRNLSASALMNYVSCPVKFYYKNVVGLKDEELANDHIDPLTMGQIVHLSMLSLYFPASMQKKYLDSPIILTPEKLQQILDNPDRIRQAVRRAVNKEHFHLPDAELDRPLTGSVAMQAPQFEAMVRNLVTWDRHKAEHSEIKLVAGELGGKAKWNTQDMARQAGENPEEYRSLDVNMSYAFDRIDMAGGRLRIVDYKSGSAKVSASTIEDIFTGEKNSRYMLQLLLYSRLLEQRVSEADELLARRISILLYDANGKRDAVEVYPVVGKQPIESHAAPEVKEFVGRFNRMLEEIFDDEKPFEPTEDRQQCTYCRYHFLCGREES